MRVCVDRRLECAVRAELRHRDPRVRQQTVPLAPAHRLIAADHELLEHLEPFVAHLPTLLRVVAWWHDAGDRPARAAATHPIGLSGFAMAPSWGMA